MTEQALRKAKKQEAKAAKVAKAQQKVTDGEEAPPKEVKQVKKQKPAVAEEPPKKTTHLQFLKDTLGGASETPPPVQVPTPLSTPEPKL